MPSSAAPRQRNLARTRRHLLDAARVEVKTRGSSVSLDAIARASGVSKGGLLHHFPTKDALLLALAEDVYANFEADVASRAAEEPAGPGRLVRAYLKATFRELLEPDVLLEHGTLLNLISTTPTVSDFVAAKLAEWDATLHADGVPADVVRLVVLAASGAAVGMITGTPPTPTMLRELEAQLIALVDRCAEVAAILDDTPDQS